MHEEIELQKLSRLRKDLIRAIIFDRILKTTILILALILFINYFLIFFKYNV